MLSSTRTRSRSRGPARTDITEVQGLGVAAMVHAQDSQALPPEILSTVFGGMPMKELIPFRAVRCVCCIRGNQAARKSEVRLTRKNDMMQLLLERSGRH